jgi:hypothetical protein
MRGNIFIKTWNIPSFDSYICVVARRDQKQDTENMENVKKRDTENAARVKKTARIRGVSERQVYRVLAGDRTDPETLATYMDLLEGERQLEENLLIKAVKDLIPF